jgi:phenylalanyl-tRNA synthetase alpha chain
VYCAVPAEGINMADLQKAVGSNVSKIGLGPCMKNKWLKKNKDTIVRVDPSRDIQDETASTLRLLASPSSPSSSSSSSVSEDEVKSLKRRKLVTQVVRKSYKVQKGVEFNIERRKRIADLTKEMFGNKAEMPPNSHWSDVGPFKPINLNAMGAPIQGGSFHPLLKVRAEFRRILMEMGFEEMPTSKWVESSFWNFDSLFQPQSHPARDAHDTFFMKEPRLANGCPEDYYERVKKTHEDGGDTGSIGYGCIFKREETMKNLLRTHTTAISAQMLYKLANQEGGFTPQKYFSIDRVFRNEAMDATHLCEFHQVEGMVADRGLTLGHLIGTIRTFFEKIGITQIRFKPAYNPYTEPSMEIFGYHPELKKWTELGNSGMFRPEMLIPMGFPSDVRVIAWGLSLERPTMIKYKIENIRDLFGHKAELISQRNAPISRFF